MSLLGNGWLVEAVAAIVGIVWLIALWRSVKRVFPIEVGGEDLLHFSRRTLFLLVSLLVADYLLFMYWFLSDYTSTSFYAELRMYHWRLQKSRLYPDDAFSPNWLFHNPWLSIFGLATISGGTTLLVYHLDWRFVSLPAYGLLYLLFLSLCGGLLDLIMIWHDRIEFTNAFSARRSSITITR